MANWVLTVRRYPMAWASTWRTAWRRTSQAASTIPTDATKLASSTVRTGSSPTARPCPVPAQLRSSFTTLIILSALLAIFRRCLSTSASGQDVPLRSSSARHLSTKRGNLILPSSCFPRRRSIVFIVASSMSFVAPITWDGSSLSAFRIRSLCWVRSIVCLISSTSCSPCEIAELIGSGSPSIALAISEFARCGPPFQSSSEIEPKFRSWVPSTAPRAGLNWSLGRA